MGACRWAYVHVLVSFGNLISIDVSQEAIMFKRVLFAILLLLSTAQIVLAHELWIEKRNGKAVLIYGHGAKVDPYDPQKVKEAKAVDIKGSAVKVEILREKESASLALAEKPAIVTAFLDRGCWLKTTDGWKNVCKRKGQGKFSIVEAIKSRKYAKAVVDKSETFSKPMGMVFEIVPDKDPFTVKPGDTLPLQILFEGKPVDGAVVKAGDVHHSDAKKELKSNTDGKTSVVIAKPGLQKIFASYRVPLKDDPDADILSLSTSLTFETK